MLLLMMMLFMLVLQSQMAALLKTVEAALGHGASTPDEQDGHGMRGQPGGNGRTGTVAMAATNQFQDLPEAHDVGDAMLSRLRRGDRSYRIP